MGYFLELLPVKNCLTLRPVAGMWDSCDRGRRACDAPSCGRFTAWPPEADGRRLCYLHSSFTASDRGVSPEFDSCVSHIESFATDDECHVSAAYLRDIHTHLERNAPEIDTLIEVGCYMGGLSAVLAALAVRHGWTLYIVDLMLPNLAYTYHRLAQLYPEATPLVRLYCGTFPEFVADIGTELEGRRAFLELDTVHSYENAVQELTASWQIRESLHSLVMHGLYYRSKLESEDLRSDHAIAAIFGINAEVQEIGGIFEGEDLPVPGEAERQHYLKSGVGEGALIDLAQNSYCFERGDHPPPPESEHPGPDAGDLEIVFPEHSYSEWPQELLIGAGMPPRLGTLDGVFRREGPCCYEQLKMGDSIQVFSANAKIVRVDPDGKLVGVAPGRTTVTVTDGTLSRTLPVRVVHLEEAGDGSTSDSAVALRYLERKHSTLKPTSHRNNPAALRQEIEMLKQSESYRLGLLITAPLRFLKRLAS